MCGFLGQVNFERKSFAWIREGLQAINHRGPDASGIWFSKCNRVVFGHQRLSILDLSEKGNQPMTLEEVGLTIVFNGEIYNHREIRKLISNMGFNKWKGNSDTETLLVAFSILGFAKTLEKVIGMFSLALYDKNSKKIYLARDRAGEKPLFYYSDQSSFIFASELKAIFANKKIDKKLSPYAFNQFLENGFVSGKNCIVNNFCKLQPAHYACLDLNNRCLTTKRYWDLPKYQPQSFTKKSYKDLTQDLFYLLNESIKDQLYADVDVGVLLSGGVDSSLVTAIASKHKSKLKTFTATFNDESHDESAYAKLISDHFGTQHYELNISMPNIELIDILSKQYDEPLADSSMIPTYMITKLVRKHCKVTLGGDGADELFGGYEHYQKALKIQNILNLFPNILKENIRNCLPKSCNPYSKTNKIIEILNRDLRGYMPKIYCLFNDNIRTNLINDIYQGYDFLDQTNNYQITNNDDLIYKLCLQDFYNYLTEDILVKIDRSSMLNSLELRSPFLDKRIIDFAFCSIPSKFKLNLSSKKIILKNLARNILPKDFDFKRKKGFSVPLDDWLKQGEFRNYCQEILFSQESIFPNIFIKNLFKSHDETGLNGSKIFAITQFEIWRKIYKVSL